MKDTMKLTNQCIICHEVFETWVVYNQHHLTAHGLNKTIVPCRRTIRTKAEIVSQWEAGHAELFV
jgi:hypothetical protein